MRNKITIKEYQKLYDIVINTIKKIPPSFGIEEDKYIESGHSFEISFKNRYIVLKIEYEWGSLPELFFYDINKKNEFSIFHLLRESTPDYQIDINYKFGSFDEKKINEIINKYIDSFLKYGKDILKGDFKIFKKLKKQKEIMLKEKEKELYE